MTTQAAADTTFKMYLNLTWKDMLRLAFQLRITSRMAEIDMQLSLQERGDTQVSAN